MIEPRAYVSDEWFSLMSAARGSYQETMACSVPDGRRNIPLVTVADVLAALRKANSWPEGSITRAVILDWLDQFDRDRGIAT